MASSHVGGTVRQEDQVALAGRSADGREHIVGLRQGRLIVCASAKCEPPQDLVDVANPVAIEIGGWVGDKLRLVTGGGVEVGGYRRGTKGHDAHPTAGAVALVDQLLIERHEACNLGIEDRVARAVAVDVARHVAGRHVLSRNRPTERV